MDTDHRDIDWDDLRLRAEAARGRAHAPYTRFHVGAAAQAPGGIALGANVQNASSGATLCAERIAVAALIASGAGRGADIGAVAVVGGPDGHPAGPCPPCGICRQVLHELNPAMAVGYLGPDGWTVRLARDLLPDAFEPPSP